MVWPCVAMFRAVTIQPAQLRYPRLVLPVFQRTAFSQDVPLAFSGFGSGKKGVLRNVEKNWLTSKDGGLGGSYLAIWPKRRLYC